MKDLEGDKNIPLTSEEFLEGLWNSVQQYQGIKSSVKTTLIHCWNVVVVLIAVSETQEMVLQEEDKNLSVEEMARKLEKLHRQAEQTLNSLSESGGQLRAVCYGQDRYWRRYWSLPTAGGLFVEGMESAEPDLFEELLQVLTISLTSLLNRNLQSKLLEKFSMSFSNNH